jgi:hypothetical protein
MNIENNTAAKITTARFGRQLLFGVPDFGRSGKMSSPSDEGNDALRKSISRNERFAQFGGVAVVFGLVVEVALTAEYGQGESVIERWWPVFANALIALGVVAEILFAAKARSGSEILQHRSDEKVAEANARAAEAALETAKLRAQVVWRKISPEQEMILRHQLSKLPSASVMVHHFIHDPESEDFSEDIAAIFRLSGWLTWVQPTRFGGNFAFGIRVPNAVGEDETASKIIQRAFADAGIDSAPLPIPATEMYTGGHGTSLGNPRADVYIGPRGRFDA